MKLKVGDIFESKEVGAGWRILDIDGVSIRMESLIDGSTIISDINVVNSILVDNYRGYKLRPYTFKEVCKEVLNNE